MENINYQSRFIRNLAETEWLKHEPLQIVDAGARGGPQSHWTLYGDSARVIGFEPDKDECEKINRMADEGLFYVPFRCYPIALSDSDATSRLFEHANKAANSLIPPEHVSENDLVFHDIMTSRFDTFAAKNGITYADFMKIDVECHEPEVIAGIGKFLENGGILGFEIEVHFIPGENVPLFSDIERLMRSHGYLLYDISIYREASSKLPSPVAWDHRDHDSRPILGPTIHGRIVHGDALFIKDIRTEREEIFRTRNITRILKLASLFEVYGLPDCAVELLSDYCSLVETVVPLNNLLKAFVPHYYGKELTYKQYVHRYYANIGRIPKKGPLKRIRYAIALATDNFYIRIIRELYKRPKLLHLVLRLKHMFIPPKIKSAGFMSE